MINQVTLTGYLEEDPKMTYVKDTDVKAALFPLSFSLAYDKTFSIRVTAYEGVAELVEQALEKGSRILVVGTLCQLAQEEGDEEEWNEWFVIARTIEPLK